jgi:hypothetical protein
VIGVHTIFTVYQLIFYIIRNRRKFVDMFVALVNVFNTVVLNWCYSCSKFIKSSYFAALISTIILCQESNYIVSHLLSLHVWMINRKFRMLCWNLSVADKHSVSRYFQYPISFCI